MAQPGLLNFRLEEPINRTKTGSAFLRVLLSASVDLIDLRVQQLRQPVSRLIDRSAKSGVRCFGVSDRTAQEDSKYDVTCVALVTAIDVLHPVRIRSPRRFENTKSRQWLRRQLLAGFEHFNSDSAF